MEKLVMLEIISLIFGGGATGLFGSLINRGFGFFEKRQNNAHEIELQTLNNIQRGMEMEREAEIAESSAAAEIRKASYSHDMAAGTTSTWVNNTLRLVRPALTIFLILLVTIIWYQLTPEDAALKEQVVATILYLTTTAFTWWFGSRDTAKMKNFNN